MGKNTKPNKIQSLPLRRSPTSDDVLVMMYVSHSEKETKEYCFQELHREVPNPTGAGDEVGQRKLPGDVFDLLVINFIQNLSAVKQSLFLIVIDMF